MTYPRSLEKLIEYFRMLPSVGSKTAERYALRILEMDAEDVAGFSRQLAIIQQSIRHCTVCGNLTDTPVCGICSDENRDHSTICVVQTAKDVLAIEKTEQYHGVYHVLNGAISTTKGILPEDINLSSLFARISEQTKEVIIATNPTLEGDTTALYISKMLKDKPLTVTRLAAGLPMGGNLDYADELTLMKAFEGRVKQ